MKLKDKNTLIVTDDELMLIFYGLVTERRLEQETLDAGKAFSNSTVQQRIDRLDEMIEVLK